MTYLAIEEARQRSPATWTWAELRRVATLRRERNVRQDVPLLALSSERGMEARPEDGGRQLPSESTISDYWLVRPGDLVFNPMWAIGGGVAVGDLIGAVSPAYRVYSPKAAVEPRFLHYWTRSAVAIAQYQLLTRGITTFDRSITREDFEGLPVPVPPRATQRAIARFLDAETARIDEVVDKKRQMIHLLGERRMAVMAEGIQGRLTGGTFVDSSLPWLDMRPEHWTDALLKLVARLGSGHTPSRNHPEWWENGTVPWITTGEVAQIRSDRVEFITETREMISELGLANSSAEVHPAGTVVLCRTASAGYSAIMGRDMATSQDFATWTCGPLLRPRYLLLCLRVMRQDLLGRLATGSTHKTIYMPDIEAIQVPLPPVSEQDEIVEAVWERLTKFDSASDLLSRQIELLVEHRQTLITAAVTGQLDLLQAT